MTKHPMSPRVMATVELVCIMVLFEAIVWGLSPLTVTAKGALWFLVALLSMALHITLLSPRLYSVSFRDYSGLPYIRKCSSQNNQLFEGAHAYILVILLSCVILIVTAQLTGQSRSHIDGLDAALKMGRYILFASVQAYVYFEYIRPRLILILGRRRVIRVALLLAAIFAVVHAPNPYFMFGASFAAFAWAILYARFPNFICVVLSHAILGTSVQVLTDWPTRIGPAYWNPDHYAFRMSLKYFWIWATGS